MMMGMRSRILSVCLAGFLVAGPLLVLCGGSVSPKFPTIDCPFMSSAVCHANILEHTFMLQQTLTTVALGWSFAIFLLALLLAFFTPLFAPSLARADIHTLRCRDVRFLRPPLFRHTLQEAFARGILHSKAF